MDLHKSKPIRLTVGLAIILVNLLCSFLDPRPALAKIDVVIHTGESMREHDCPEPRRLMHDTVVQEFNNGTVLRVVNSENLPQPSKFHRVDYHVGANLIAFDAAPDLPVRVSLCIQLVRYESGKVIHSTSRAVSMRSDDVKAALKLGKQDFDRSRYGTAITALSKETAHAFEEEVTKMKL